MEPQAKPARRGPKPNPHTRDNLLRAGTRMLHGAGYSATGIKEIVDAADVPKGSFYNYFQSKEDFGRAVVDFYFEGGSEGLRARLEDEKVPPRDRLRDFFEERIRGFTQAGFERGCLLGNMSLEVADHSTAIRERLAAHFATWSGLFATCIAEAQEAGAICNPQSSAVLAQFLLNSWEGALLRMRAEKSAVPLQQFVEVVFGSVLT